MFKVKLTFPYPEWDLLRQTPNSAGIWGDVKFYVNQDIDECDYWFVFNHLLRDTESVRCPSQNVVLLTGEPHVIQKYNPSFLNQFARIVTCQREIKHPNVTYFHQGHPWFVGARYRNGHYLEFSKGYDELIEKQHVTKTKKISVITSNKQFTDGHKRRYDFVMRLKEHFGDAIDLYGRGVKDFEDKWDVLADYKYSIAIENFVLDDWITEKLYDCFLAHTFPIYYGCPNLEKYFPGASFERIDIEKWDDSITTIEKILNQKNYYESRLPAVVNAKDQYLNRYNIFPLIVSLIKENERKSAMAKNVELVNCYKPTESFVSKLKKRGKLLIRKFY